MSDDTDTIDIEVLGHMIMWNEKDPNPHSKRGTIHRAEFRGWRGSIPFDTATELLRKTPGCLKALDGDTPEVVPIQPPSAPTGTVEELIAMVNQAPLEERRALAMKLSEAELLSPKPRKGLIEFLDVVLQDADIVL